MSVTMHQPDPELIGVYLNDHIAGAAGGVDLARRIARAHLGTEVGPVLERVATEIAEDREALFQVAAALEVPVRRYKVLGAWLGEKIGRLKLNGHLFSRSPLSSVLELEAMMIGVLGKAAGWRTLRAVAEYDRRLDPGRIDELLARAQSQAAILEELRMRAVDAVLAEELAPA